MRDLLVVAFVGAALAACGGNGTNSPPAVDAGADQTVVEGTTITLAGTASDADGTVTSTTWTQVNGFRARLAGADSPTATLRAPAAPFGANGTAEFEFTATDDQGASASSRVTVTSTPFDYLLYRATGSATTLPELHRVRLDTWARGRVSHAPPPGAYRGVETYAVSPGGLDVAYAWLDDASLRTCDPNGGGNAVVDASGFFSFGFAWAPDAMRLACAAAELSDVRELFTVLPDGTTWTRVSAALAPRSQRSPFPTFSIPMATWLRPMVWRAIAVSG